jgi:hypothetical protein
LSSARLIADVGTLDALLRGEIAQMQGVKRISTTVALKTIKRRALIMPCVLRLRGGESQCRRGLTPVSPIEISVDAQGKGRPAGLLL